MGGCIKEIINLTRDITKKDKEKWVPFFVSSDHHHMRKEAQ